MFLPIHMLLDYPEVVVLGLPGLDFFSETTKGGGMEHLEIRLSGLVEEPLGNVGEAVEGLQAQVFDLEVHYSLDGRRPRMRW